MSKPRREKAPVELLLSRRTEQLKGPARGYLSRDSKSGAEPPFVQKDLIIQWAPLRPSPKTSFNQRTRAERHPKIVGCFPVIPW